jgi:deoxyribonuclease-4
MAKETISLGGNTFQFFTRNPRGAGARAINQSDIEKFLKFKEENGIGTILAHAPYVLNPCSASEETRELAVRLFADDIKRMEYIPESYYNFHPGSHLKQGVEKGIEYISEMLNTTLKKEQTTTVLLETMAGKGSEVGSKFEELRMIIDRTKLDGKLGVCLDTCHVYDAGYDIVNNLDGVIAEFDRIIGLERLKAIHLNDSKNPFASHKDRHEKIGEGSIGLDAVKRIINHPKLKDLPFFLETPNDSEGYAKEIALLKAMRND